MKPYLISTCSYTPGVDRYIKSLSNLLETVELVYVDFTPHLVGEISGLSSVRRIKEPRRYPGPQARWQHIPTDLDLDRWWIFTDTQDVVFQRPIEDLDRFDSRCVLVQYEGMTHAENGFWSGYIESRSVYQNLLPLPVFCSGTVAAKGRVMMEFIKYIGNCDQTVWDQLHFNQWLIGRHVFNSQLLSAALYTNGYNGKLVKTISGEFVWEDTGIVPAIVHGNGCSKELLPD